MQVGTGSTSSFHSMSTNRHRGTDAGKFGRKGSFKGEPFHDFEDGSSKRHRVTYLYIAIIILTVVVIALSLKLQAVGPTRHQLEAISGRFGALEECIHTGMYGDLKKTLSDRVVEGDYQAINAIEKGLPGDLPYLVRADSNKDKKLVEYRWPMERARYNSDQPRIVVLTLLQDLNSFGKGLQTGSGRDGLDRFMDLVANLTYPPHLLSFGVIVGDLDSYNTLNIYFNTIQNKDSKFSRVLLMQSNHKMADLTRANRKDNAIQADRRRFLSILRNMILMEAIGDSDVTLWIDSDIISIPEGILQEMIESDKDIITPSCVVQGNTEDYDKNAWKGPRLKRPADWDENKLFVPNGVNHVTKFVLDFAEGDQDFVEFDSVGGTLLYVKSDIHRAGVVYPPYYIIGAEWDNKEGYDGIESEGICYIAKTIGKSCWAMPHRIILHVDG